MTAFVASNPVAPANFEVPVAESRFADGGYLAHIPAPVVSPSASPQQATSPLASPSRGRNLAGAALPLFPKVPASSGASAAAAPVGTIGVAPATEISSAMTQQCIRLARCVTASPPRRPTLRPLSPAGDVRYNITGLAIVRSSLSGTQFHSPGRSTQEHPRRHCHPRRGGRKQPACWQKGGARSIVHSLPQSSAGDMMWRTRCSIKRGHHRPGWHTCGDAAPSRAKGRDHTVPHNGWIVLQHCAASPKGGLESVAAGEACKGGCNPHAPSARVDRLGAAPTACWAVAEPSPTKPGAVAKRRRARHEGRVTGGPR